MTFPRPEPRWRRYLRFFGPDTRRDVDDELESHLAMRVEEYVAEGLSPAEARRKAAERFGSVVATRAECLAIARGRRRRAARAERLSDLWSDLRHALRALWRQRVFSAAVVGTLALGIGATTAMFSAVDAAFLRPLPFPRPEQLVTLRNIDIPFAPAGQVLPSRRPDIGAVGAVREIFSSVAAYASGGLNLEGAGPPLRVGVATVTTGFFTTLGVHPAHGRSFTGEEGRPGYAQVAVLSYGLWQRWFGGGAVLGRSIRLNDRSYTIVGVMPRSFTFPEGADLWIPMTVPLTFASFEPVRGFLASQVVARLAEGASLGQARAELRLLWQRAPAEVRASFPEAIADPLAPLQRTLLGDRRTSLLVLLGATVLLLLIACANATNLLLTRGAGRGREIAVRAVLGATRQQLVRLLLAESVILAVAGAAAGLALALGSLGLIRTLLPEAMNSVAAANIDFRVLAFAVVLASATGLGFGLLPALSAARSDVATAMKAGGGGATRRGDRVRRVLVVGELALALTLLAGASLMLRSFRALLETHPGFRSQHVGTLELTFPAQTPRAAELAVLDGTLDRLRGMPDIAAAGVVNDLPLRGGGRIAITVEPEGRPTPPDGRRPGARYLQASAGYFHALGIPLLEGRLMTARDDSAAPPVVVISATMARELWPGEDPVGQRLQSPAGLAPRTVIGVVSDVRELGLDQAPMPQMYFPVHETPPQNVAVVARGTLPPGALLAALRGAVRGADSTQAVYDVRMMDDVMASSLAPRRANTQLITAFGALALLLALVGVYGVVAYGVAQRSRELAIRAALGATGGNLLRLVAGESAWLALIGIGLGIPATYAFSRVLASLLYGVEPTDPATYIGVAAALLVAVLAATAGPARRAAGLNPVDVMRAE